MAGSPMFRSLRHRNARLFFVGLLVSNIGTWMQMTAMSLLVYGLTGKATDVGITLLCQFLPMLLLGVWAGAVADRVEQAHDGASHPDRPGAAGAAARRARAGWARQPAGRVRSVAAARRHRRVRQPGAARVRDRTGRAGRDRQRDLAEHRGHDRLAHRRPGAGRGAGGSARRRLVVHRQRAVVRRDPAGRCCASTRASCTVARRPRGRHAGTRRAVGIVPQRAHCWWCSWCSPSSARSRSTTACRC